MATFGHLAVAALVARTATRSEDSRADRLRRLVATSICAVAPDLDLALRWLGVPRGNTMIAHRGASHALVLGPMLAVALMAVGAKRRDAVCYGVALSTHGVIDLLSNSDRGTAVAWPFSHARFALPGGPVPAAPLGVRELTSAMAVRAFVTELVLFSPVITVALWPGTRAFYAVPE